MSRLEGKLGRQATSWSRVHLHHLTPANEGGGARLPGAARLGQLHGTELALLRAIQAGPPAGLALCAGLAARLRRWAKECALLVVPPGAELEAALLLGLERGRCGACRAGSSSSGSGRARSPARSGSRFGGAGWSSSRRVGTRAAVPAVSPTLTRISLPSRLAGRCSVYVGRFTAVKRLPLLIRAHARAVAQLARPLPLVLVGGHPRRVGRRASACRRAPLGNRQVFLAGWRTHAELPQALNAADLLVLPSVAEAFGLVLVEAMACGLPVIACRTARTR